MIKHIYHWHQAIVRKIAAAFGLTDDLGHHHRLNGSPQLIKIHASKINGIGSKFKEDSKHTILFKGEFIYIFYYPFE